MHTTKQGTHVDMNGICRAQHITKISNCGQHKVMQFLTFTGEMSSHVEFFVTWEDFEIVDEFGQKHFVCEIDIIQ